MVNDFSKIYFAAKFKAADADLFVTSTSAFVSMIP